MPASEFDREELAREIVEAIRQARLDEDDFAQFEQDLFRLVTAAGIFASAADDPDHVEQPDAEPALGLAFDALLRGFYLNRKLLLDTGAARLAGRNLHRILEGATVDDLPRDEIELLGSARREDPTEELAHALDAGREHAPEIEEMMESGELEARLRALEEEVQELRRQGGTRPRGRGKRWRRFAELTKGLVLTLGDAGLAVGAVFGGGLAAPLAAVPVVTSVGTGIGAIFEGLAEAEGEEGTAGA